jgi:hypothetical protein
MTSRFKQIDHQTTEATFEEGSRVLAFREVLDFWVNDKGFREYFTSVICESAFDAFFWETPPVTASTLERPFKFVLVESTSLAGLRSDPKPFASHFSSCRDAAVLTFPNLGGDAILVVPVPLADDSCYTHLAKFIRTAPASQVDAFWQAAGRAMRDRISGAPTWLSTAGMGVSWLHLRLDSRPKYYRYAPYKGSPSY